MMFSLMQVIAAAQPQMHRRVHRFRGGSWEDDLFSESTATGRSAWHKKVGTALARLCPPYAIFLCEKVRGYLSNAP
jgi:hypothetical protein